MANTSSSKRRRRAHQGWLGATQPETSKDDARHLVRARAQHPRVRLDRFAQLAVRVPQHKVQTDDIAPGTPTCACKPPELLAAKAKKRRRQEATMATPRIRNFTFAA